MTFDDPPGAVRIRQGLEGGAFEGGYVYQLEQSMTGAHCGEGIRANGVVVALAEHEGFSEYVHHLWVGVGGMV